MNVIITGDWWKKHDWENLKYLEGRKRKEKERGEGDPRPSLSTTNLTRTGQGINNNLSRAHPFILLQLSFLLTMKSVTY
jgi:hypothetical protein